MLAAVENNNSDVINLLISAGADYDVTDRVSAVFIQYLFTNHYLYFDNFLELCISYFSAQLMVCGLVI